MSDRVVFQGAVGPVGIDKRLIVLGGEDIFNRSDYDIMRSNLFGTSDMAAEGGQRVRKACRPTLHFNPSLIIFILGV